MKIIISILVLFTLSISIAQENFQYNHILITNDDGVEDADRLLALAKSVKKVSKRVSVIVSEFDRSGTSNYTTLGKHQSTLEVTCEYYDSTNNIRVYVMPGNPADCVLLGLNGLFPNDKPDLVLSGINGGANIGAGWFGSGTIGAIRTAAFLGVPGVALSGFEDDDERSYSVIPNWITQFISSDLVDLLGKNQYLTIGFPDVALEEFKGVKISNRKVSLEQPESIAFQKIHGDQPHSLESKTIWTLSSSGSLASNEPKLDSDWLREGYIVITPMSIDENDSDLYILLVEKEDQIPGFSIK